MAFYFRPAANATEVHLALAVAAPYRSPLLFAWIWWLIQWAVCLALYMHSGSRPAAITTELWVGLTFCEGDGCLPRRCSLLVLPVV